MEREKLHDLAVTATGELVCYWCRSPMVSPAVQLDLPCEWKLHREHRIHTGKFGEPLPDELVVRPESSPELHGRDLIEALRKWWKVAPYSSSGCKTMRDPRCAFLRWAIAGRIRQLLADLDASDHPTDAKVAALIREMAGWPPMSGAAGMAHACSHVAWGFIGSELGHPVWTRTKEYYGAAYRHAPDDGDWDRTSRHPTSRKHLRPPPRTPEQAWSMMESSLPDRKLYLVVDGDEHAEHGHPITFSDAPPDFPRKHWVGFYELHSPGAPASTGIAAVCKRAGHVFDLGSTGDEG